MRADYLAVVEAAYAVDQPVDVWLKMIAEAAAPTLNAGLGVITMRYRIHEHGMDADVAGTAPWTPDKLAPMTEQANAACALHPSLKHQLYLAGPPVAFAKGQTAGLDATANAALDSVYQAIGMRDALGIRGIDPSGHGIVLAVPLRENGRITGRRRRTLSRLATHLAAAVRLRLSRPVPLDQSDAVFETNGACVHVSPELEASTPLPALTQGVERLVRGRKFRRADPDQAVELWTSLIAGHFSVFETLDTDGKRFLVARRNAPSVTDPRALSDVERRVACYASWGHSQKLIAYELGLTAPTVSHHLKQALRKLGLKHRGELVAVFGPGAPDAEAAQ
ncbi:MAG TPA: LuxR C-terminal-related transcriptional regulator [Polyangiaceae bacterium]|nr:LuxR C-terminal-related transcriptional regulator [Polyangiaceae bacterium]